MQGKEITRTDTATLVEYMRRCANADRNCDNEPNKVFSEIVDRMAEQEETIRHLRVEICNASAVAMENREVVLKLKRSACDTFLDLRETIAKLRY